MTSTLPAELRDVFRRFITTEYVTVGDGRQPIIWPVNQYYEDGGPTIDVTTGVGYPKKALDARRNPRVALLFSDPTGSGIESRITALVQGMAKVDDTDLGANRERYRRELLAKMPASRRWLPPRLLEGMFGWYYERIYVKTRPERIFVWPDGDFGRAPIVHDAHQEEVRSGHSEEPAEVAAVPEGGGVAWDGRLAELGQRHRTAALAWLAPDGFPLAARVPVEVDAGARRVKLGEGPAELPIAEGPACIAAHAHAPDFSWQENFQVRGDLARDEQGWALVPHKLIGGFETPDEGALARVRRNLGKSVRFYRKRREILKQRG